MSFTSGFLRIAVVLVSLIMAGSTIQAQTPAPASSKMKAKTEAKSAAPDASKLIDINTATTAELKSLPGIGDAYATAITKNRPYKTKTQLQSRKVVPDATYAKIKDKIVAKQ